MKKIVAPPAPRLASSLREGNHNSKTAIEDIVDNSIDATASQIIIKTGVSTKNPQIVIGDNGIGMSEETLINALTFGKSTNDGKSNRMGRFGMGLKTAAGHLGDKFTVLTRSDEGKVILKGVFDYNLIKQENEWVVQIGEATKEDEDIFTEYVRNPDDSPDHSGTVIVIEQLRHHSSYASVTQFATQIIPDLGTTFRYFVEEMCDITVNGKEVRPVDVGERHLKSTGVVFDEDIEVLPGRYVHGTVVFLDRNEKGAGDKDKGNFNLPCNHNTQGVYVYRNNRLVVEGGSGYENAADGKFGWLWGREDASKNYCRIILSYTDCDDLFMVNNDKTSIKEINQAVKDKLISELKNFVQMAANKEKAEEKRAAVTNPDDQKAHNDVSRLVSNKRNVLEMPDAQKIERGPRKKKSRKGKSPKTNIRRYGIDPDKKNAVEKFRVETYDGQIDGFMDFGISDNNVVVLKYNVQHPFYAEYIAGKTPSQIQGIDLVLFAFAAKLLKHAQITSDSDDGDTYAAFLDDLRSSVSSNLRMILS